MGKESSRVLQERGIRVTPQRAHVWRVLIESGEHFTAEEIWSRASDSLPGLELSTVYRALETLGEVGLVAESRLPEGPRVFEARSTGHPHLVCVECGGISHPQTDLGAGLFALLSESSDGFEVRDVHVTARGVCAGCAGQGEAESGEDREES